MIILALMGVGLFILFKELNERYYQKGKYRLSAIFGLLGISFVYVFSLVRGYTITQYVCIGGFILCGLQFIANKPFLGKPKGGRLAQTPLYTDSISRKYCHKCGNPMLATAAFCPNCGAKQAPQAEEPLPLKDMAIKDKKFPRLIITNNDKIFVRFVLCLFLVPIVITGIYVFGIKACYHYYWRDEDTLRNGAHSENALYCIDSSDTIDAYSAHFARKLGLIPPLSADVPTQPANINQSSSEVPKETDFGANPITATNNSANSDFKAQDSAYSPTPIATVPTAPGINCQDSHKTAIDVLVCSSPQLVSTDAQINAAYYQLRHSLDQNAFVSLKEEQKEWLAKRAESCGVKFSDISEDESSQIVLCLQGLYDARLSILQSLLQKAQ